MQAAAQPQHPEELWEQHLTGEAGGVGTASAATIGESSKLGEDDKVQDFDHTTGGDDSIISDDEDESKDETKKNSPPETQSNDPGAVVASTERLLSEDDAAAEEEGAVVSSSSSSGLSGSMYDGLDDYDFGTGYDYNDPAKIMKMRMESKRKSHSQQALSNSGGGSTLPPASIVQHTIQSLPTFKAATGCTDASDFIVNCFLARLRSGITVLKYARSRWWFSKSHLRVLHICLDGHSLTWKPSESSTTNPEGAAAAVAASGGGTTTHKTSKVLDLNTCIEVRHAWTPDPQNPMYTGTPILRQKCEASNAHKSFALIFPRTTLDITACTADQCKVLIEGFSALCYRLHLIHQEDSNKAGANKRRTTKGRNKSSRDGGSSNDDNDDNGTRFSTAGLSTSASASNH